MVMPPITGVVLAGGLGRRMGRVDKGLQLLQGKPMVQWAIERLAPQVDLLLVNANQNEAIYGALGHRVIADAIPGFAGPLAGLHAALSAAETPLVATVPCDSPFLPLDLVARLGAPLLAADAEVAVARTFDQVHPVFCLCRRALLPHLTAYLQAGERKFETWFGTLRAIQVNFDEQAAGFENINTLEELQRWSGP